MINSQKNISMKHTPRIVILLYRFSNWLSGYDRLYSWMGLKTKRLQKSLALRCSVTARSISTYMRLPKMQGIIVSKNVTRKIAECEALIGSPSQLNLTSLFACGEW